MVCLCLHASLGCDAPSTPPSPAPAPSTRVPPDTAAPVVTITAGPDLETTSTDAVLAFEATDLAGSVAGLECRLDGDAFAACTSPTTLTALALGKHSFQVRARDDSGNVSVPATHAWSVVELVPGPEPKAVVYAAPTGLTPSPHFEVEVLEEGFAPRSSFVNYHPARIVTTPGIPGTEHHAGRSFSFTTFETPAPVKVRVKRLTGAFSSAVVRPTRYGISPTQVAPDTLEFTLEPEQKVSVELDTSMALCYYDGVVCVRDILTIFADKKDEVSPVASYPEAEIARPKPGLHAGNVTFLNNTLPLASTLGSVNGAKAVVFGPGVYDIGYWEVPPSIEHIHLEGGAMVFGAINTLPLGTPPAPDDYLEAWKFTLRPTFQLTGHGVLSGSKLPWHVTQDFAYCEDDLCGWWKMTRLLRIQAKAFTVADVTLADSPYWTVALGSAGDAQPTGHLDGVKILAQWSHNNDGAPLTTNGSIKNSFVQTNDDGVTLTASGGTIEQCVMWQFNNGASFQLGWYPKTISNITIKGIDLIHGEWWWGAGDNSGLLTFGPTSDPSSGAITNIDVSDVRIEGDVLRLVGLTPSPGQKLANVKFTDIRVDAWGNDTFNSKRFNVIEGLGGASIKGLAFNGLTVGGQLVDEANSETLGQMTVTGDVTGLTFGP